MSRPVVSGQGGKPHQRNTRAVREPCAICNRPSKWGHHVAGRANAPQVVVPVCRRCADVLDAFLGLAGVKLKHDEPRTAAVLVWAAIVGLDGLRAAREGKPELSPVAVAAVRLISTNFSEVRGPRPAAADARHRKRRRPLASTAGFETARASAMHDLFAAFQAAGEQMPNLLEALRLLATNPDLLEAFERLDPGAFEPVYVEFEDAAVELLDAWRAAEAGDRDAQAAAELVERRFGRAVHHIAQEIELAVRDRAGRSPKSSA